MLIDTHCHANADLGVKIEKEETQPLYTRPIARAKFEASIPLYLRQYGVNEAEIEKLSARVKKITGPQWRAHFYNSDVYFRAGAYDWARQELFSPLAWHELSSEIDKDHEAIADQVYRLLYGDQLRVFHAYKDKDVYLAVPTRRNLDPEIIKGFMRNEVKTIITREQITHKARRRGLTLRAQDLPEWKTVEPFDATDLWAFNAKRLGEESDEEDESA